MTTTHWIAFALVAFVSWLLTFGTRRLALMLGAVDHPTGGRKIHKTPTPRFGGVGIILAIAAAVLIGLRMGWFEGSGLQPIQLYGFLTALAIVAVVGMADDRFDLPWWTRLAAASIACLVVIASGTMIVHITHPSGGIITLPLWASIPFTFGWLLTVTFVTKLMDGLDGLVAGQTVIGAALIAALAFSPLYFQPNIGLLSLLVLAAFVGFLPVNLHPAKQFLGETGSVAAGFALGFLAVVSGAKVATAFMALGVPMADAALVILGRLMRGASPFRGDDTHLHFKLLRAGLSQRQVVAFFWFVAAAFGITALGLQSRGKMLLVVALVALTFLLSFFVRKTPRKRGLFFLLAPPLSLLLVTGALGVAKNTQEWRARPRTVFVNDRRMVVELALTPAQQERGLSGRPRLAKDHGLLFPFSEEGMYPFWMKRMRFPIDIIWIRDGVIVEIAEHLPPPKRETDEAVTHVPSVAADRVLELSDGGAERYGLRVGDTVGALTALP